LTYQGKRVEDAVRSHAEEFENAPLFQCDVTSDGSLRALAKARGKIDGLVHSMRSSTTMTSPGRSTPPRRRVEGDGHQRDISPLISARAGFARERHLGRPDQDRIVAADRGL
jgi:hypothetical protein